MGGGGLQPANGIESAQMKQAQLFFKNAPLDSKNRQYRFQFGGW